MDFGTILGLLIGFGLILVGQALEGGHVSSVLAFPPVLIVFGGTLGAAMVGAPLKDVLFAFKSLKLAFGNPQKRNPGELVELLVKMAKTARRDGLLALDGLVQGIDDKFMQTAVRHVVDGVESGVLREILEAEIGKKERDLGVAAKFWEAAGGYAPTIGIVGAVLGLIHTMENLSDPSKIGSGIATAFVATVYGVGGANIIFLPIAAKMKRKVELLLELDEMIIEGVLGVQAGHNAHVIEARLEMYLSGKKPAAEAPAKQAAASA